MNSNSLHTSNKYSINNLTEFHGKIASALSTELIRNVTHWFFNLKNYTERKKANTPTTLKEAASCVSKRHWFIKLNNDVQRDNRH